MNNKQFISFKLYSAIDLKKTASYFGLSNPESRDRCIIFESPQLEQIYKYKMHRKKVYAFSFGCIVFEGMEIDETGSFFDSLQFVIGEPDYKMLTRYREIHHIGINEKGSAHLWKESTEAFQLSEDTSYTIAFILAKSTALSKQESDIDILLHEADSYLDKFQRGILNTETRKFTATMARIIRFEKESAAGIRIFDRPARVGRSLMLRYVYDKLSEYYELEDRYDILEKKAAELRSIVRSYTSIRYRRQENRLLVFEIFLLLLFPLFRILEEVLAQIDVESFIQLIFTNLLQKFNIFS